MRREDFFSGDSPYEVMVRTNLLLHSEAAELVAEHVGELQARRAPRRAPEEPIRFLDLACGVPLTPADAMAKLPGHAFAFTGVDINADQVAKARRLPMPENVVEASFFEGSAWELSELRRQSEDHGAFDVVYVGMNWHHGTPEEIWFLARQLLDVLVCDGLVLNHDCYRPEGTTYLRRPSSATENGETVSLDMVDPGVISAAGTPSFGPPTALAGPARPAWKADLIGRLERGYRAGGGHDAGARVAREHSWTRDYPLSVAEVRAILEGAGYAVDTHRYPESSGPLAPYAAFVKATPAAS